MKNRNLFSVFVIVALFASCSKQGPIGLTGPQGPAGTSGSSTITSQTYTVTNWVDPVSNVNWISEWPATAITNNNSDVVVVYWSTPFVTGWTAMPTSDLANTADVLGYKYVNDSIEFTYYTNGTYTVAPSSYNGTSGYPNLTTMYFKVAVIPADVQSKYPTTNWQNASEVQYVPEVQAALNKANTK